MCIRYRLYISSFRNSDILIIGSGLSGLSAALMLPDNLKITLITKTTLDECSTSWAQGGIASVTSKTDSFKKHLDDTLANGHGIINENVAREIIKEGPSCIECLIKVKDADFDHTSLCYTQNTQSSPPE